MSRILIIVFIFLLIDSYFFKGFSLLISSYSVTVKLTLKSLYWLINLLVYYQIYRIASNFRTIQSENPESMRFWSGVLVTVLVVKLGFIFFHILDDLFWGGRIAVNYLGSKVQSTDAHTISRNKFLTQIGAGAAFLLLGSFTYGITKGKYAFKVMKEKISFDNLPKAFHGLKIVQISDLHLGSFVNDFEEIEKAIDIINEQEADLLFFTGDMVNVHSDEAEPWIEIFSKLKAKKGKYSIFGNHDYADYGPYSKEEKLQSVNRLREIQKEMGFKLLEDENFYLEENNEKIAIAGMHNWGKDFHRVGNLENTLKGLHENDFTLLLSHDPSLWEEQVLNKKNIELTFSGHTHGMQLGIEIPYMNFKWSPAKYRYKRWGGLYKEAKNYIYVNRGFGFLGFPGRVGIKPEITVIELFKA